MDSFLKNMKAHLLAFLAVLLIFFAYFPGIFLESKELNMSDINRSSASSKEARDFRDKTGEVALWTNSQFGGMPTYQMNIKYPKNLVSHLEDYTKIFLPYSLGLLFTMFIGFYFISACLGVSTWISITGAFAFTFSTFFIVSLEAGHTGKLRAIGYMAPVLASIIIIMRGRYLLGGALTALFLSLAINANHFQITYYLGLMVAVLMITELYFHFREKMLKDFFLKSAVLSLAAVLSVGPNISRLWTTYDYSKETMRGGSSELASYKDSGSEGLEKDYAMSWSYGVAETFTLIVPDLYGGSSMSSLPMNSATAEDLRKRGVPKNQLESILERLPLYWGDQPFISGPVFVGAAIFYLFLLSLFVLRGKLKIWLLVCTVFSVVLSWGSNFAIVNDLFFYYFPMYNKFRTPSMILSVACITIPLLAMLGLNKILKSNNGIQSYLPEIKKAFYIAGGTCLVLFLFGSSLFSFSGATDAELPEGWPIEALMEDRAKLLSSSALKSLMFISLTFFLLLAHARNKVSRKYFIAGMIAVIGIDLWMTDKKYLNDSHLVKRKSRDAFYVDTEADKMILQDKDPNYRVFNVSVNPFTDAMTSFHHKSIGGYHGAKLIRYQDIIENHLSKNNTKVIDMLNTRYYIVQNRENGQLEVRGNPGALGNAWFIDTIRWADDADREIAMLNEFDPKREVIIDKRFSAQINKKISPASAGSTIRLVHYDPNKIIYETDSGTDTRFAVFSEVYYEGTDNDWKVSIDGKAANHIRVNYILRGMEVPPGKHVIEFRFEPVSYFKGEQYSLAFSLTLFGAVIAAAIAEALKNRRKKD